MSGARVVPGERRPDPSLLARPSLVPAGDAARDRLRGPKEAAAAIAWIVRAWLAPAGTEARWQQRVGRESPGDETGTAAGRAGRTGREAGPRAEGTARSSPAGR